METEYQANITKVDESRRMFFGWSYVIKKNGEYVEDHSGDVVDTPEAIEAMEDAFYAYALNSRDGDDGHSVFGVAKMIEQVVYTPEKIEAMGLHPDSPLGVWSGYQCPETELGEKLWQSIKSGQYKSLSIVGRGRRELIDA